jgi:hypothetical protein
MPPSRTTYRRSVAAATSWMCARCSRRGETREAVAFVIAMQRSPAGAVGHGYVALDRRCCPLHT